MPVATRRTREVAALPTNQAPVQHLDHAVGALGDGRVVGDDDHRRPAAGAGVLEELEDPGLLSESRAPVGSSASSRRGSLASARATATRWRSPPDSSPGRWSVRSCSPTSSSSSAARARRSVRPRRGGDERDLDVGLGGEHRQQVVELEDEADHVAVVARQPAVLARRLAVDEDRSGVRLAEPADDAEQRALARSAGAHQGHALARLDVQRDVVDGQDRAADAADPLQDDVGAGGHRA